MIAHYLFSTNTYTVLVVYVFNVTLYIPIRYQYPVIIDQGDLASHFISVLPTMDGSGHIPPTYGNRKKSFCFFNGGGVKVPPQMILFYFYFFI